MINSYRILTDSSCDLPYALAQELGVLSVPLSVNLKGSEIENLLEGDPKSQLNMKEFYDTLRTGAMTSTTAANPGKWAGFMEPVLAEGKDLLVLAFSSGLSATYSSAVLAANELREKYPDRKIRVVDTLCASLGQGLLVYLAAKRQAAGESMAQVGDWVQDHVLHLCHWFTVDDLMFLKRGGRVSAATAVAGTLLKIKPVMHVDDNGKLVKVSTARGRKASIDALAAKVGETAIDPQNQVCFISHGDCMEDVRYLEKILRETYHVQDVVVSHVGPVIGSHAGPGVLALFFLGSKR